MAGVCGAILVVALVVTPCAGFSAALYGYAAPDSAEGSVSMPDSAEGVISTPDTTLQEISPAGVARVDSAAGESGRPVPSAAVAPDSVAAGSIRPGLRVAAPRDTLVSATPVPEVAAEEVTRPRTTDIDAAAPGTGTGAPSPKAAVWRSVLYPGWGQLANGKPFKACVVFGVETYFLGVAVLSSRRAQDILDQSRFATSQQELDNLELRYDRYIDRRNAFLWWLGAAILYSMLDAYVDASLAEVEEGFAEPPPFFLDSDTGEDGELWFGVGARF